jgi:serine/threonine protein kinase
MASPPTNVTQFCELLTRSKLLTPAEVARHRVQWLAAGTVPSAAERDPRGFRKALVAADVLTPYQAGLIERGHSGGFVVGGYVVLDRVGKGQSAGVYKARHLSGQLVALKVLPASRAADPAVLERFVREGKLLTRLDHPHVVKAFEAGHDRKVAFLAMELLDGETLADLLARRPRLGHLHERSVVHRDLSPANLMVVPGGGPTTLESTLKILDIGVGREAIDAPTTEGVDAAATVAGAIVGTPDYLAPEQARDARSADVRADIYSLGCVLFHLLTGQPPLSGPTVLATVVRHATEPAPRLASLGIKAPPGLQEALDGLTAKSPADRPATPAAAAAMLRSFLPTGGDDAPTSDMLPQYKAWLDAAPGPNSGGGDPDTDLEIVKPPPADRPKRHPGRIASPSSAEINVELVEETPPRRGLLDLDRRDFVMLTAGAVGVTAAAGAGYALSKLLAGKPVPPPEEQPTGE